MCPAHDHEGMLEGKGYGHDLHSSYVFHDVFVHPAEGSAFQKNQLAKRLHRQMPARLVFRPTTATIPQ